MLVQRKLRLMKSVVSISSLSKLSTDLRALDRQLSESAIFNHKLSQGWRRVPQLELCRIKDWSLSFAWLLLPAPRCFWLVLAALSYLAAPGWTPLLHSSSRFPRLLLSWTPLQDSFLGFYLEFLSWISFL